MCDLDIPITITGKRVLNVFVKAKDKCIKCELSLFMGFLSWCLFFSVVFLGLDVAEMSAAVAVKAA